MSPQAKANIKRNLAQKLLKLGANTKLSNSQKEATAISHIEEVIHEFEMDLLPQPKYGDEL